MKPGIHPTYYDDALVICACGNQWRTGSTKKEIHTDVCSDCHPFYTGEQRIVDTAGQVERFMKRQAAKQQIVPKPAVPAEEKPSKKERRPRVRGDMRSGAPSRQTATSEEAATTPEAVVIEPTPEGYVVESVEVEPVEMEPVAPVSETAAELQVAPATETPAAAAAEAEVIEAQASELATDQTASLSGRFTPELGANEAPQAAMPTAEAPAAEAPAEVKKSRPRKPRPPRKPRVPAENQADQPETPAENPTETSGT